MTAIKLVNGQNLSLCIPGREDHPFCYDLAEVSACYSAARDRSGEGASTFPDGKVYADGKLVARVSYNGKVWAPGKWKEGDEPVFDPSAK